MELTKGASNQLPRTEDEARAMVERLRWPDGPVCPHCGAADPYRLIPKPDSKRPGRKGLLKCRARECRKQFTVTVGTIFEDSHIPLVIWLQAFHLVCSSKKGISAHQLHRMLGVTYRSAWFMAHRIRYAMTQEPLSSKLGADGGHVEIDECYVGGRKRGAEFGTGRGTVGKVPVVALVERGGRVRAQVMKRVTAKNLRAAVLKHVDPSALVMTDELNANKRAFVGLYFHGERHLTVNHSRGEYARGIAGTNHVEGFFSLLKRGVTGVFHHVSEQHLNRYVDEFVFRYDHLSVTDAARAALAVQAAQGKRLTLRPVARAAR